MQNAILAPAAVLVAWSLIMLLWMAGTRFPAMAKAGVDIGGEPGGRGMDLEAALDAKTMWKSHNYTHLMEQPTIFYAAVLIIAVAGTATDLMVSFAWGYVILRIIHSIWQAVVNQVTIRFALFILSTVCLAVLSYHAVASTI
ncbi:MAG: MAPEG family protein [Sphingorhabdus sp.]